MNEKFTVGVGTPIKTLEKGLKLDNGKPEVGDFIKDFGISLLEVSKIWAFGAKKYARANWKLVDNAEKRYTDAMIRHFIAEETNEFDDESKMLHAAHVAWNALARLFFIIKRVNK